MTERVAGAAPLESDLDALDRDGKYGPPCTPTAPGTALVSFLDDERDASAHFYLKGVSPRSHLRTLSRFARDGAPKPGDAPRVGLARTLSLRYAQETAEVTELRHTGNRHAFSSSPASSYIVVASDINQSVELYLRYSGADGRETVRCVLPAPLDTDDPLTESPNSSAGEPEEPMQPADDGGDSDQARDDKYTSSPVSMR